MRFLPLYASLLFFVCATALVAHPLPDIPVRASFEADGKFTLKVEVDPRCFAPDPELETYLLSIQLKKLISAEEQESMKKQAKAFVDRGIDFIFEPGGGFRPDLAWEFTTLGGGPLVNIDDPVVITGTWHSTLPAGTKGYYIQATDPRNLAVVFENTLQGKLVERKAVLFPKEKSFTLDMSGDNATAASAPAEITAESEKAPAKPEAKSGGGMSWIAGGALVVAAAIALWLARLGRP